MISPHPVIDRFQVYGERCSGTNFVIRLMERNILSARFTEEFGHKHWYAEHPECIPASCLVVVVARDPYDWVRSLHRKPWHVAPALKELGFSDFIRAQWVGGIEEDGIWREHERERHPLSGCRFRDVMQLRQVKLHHWASLRWRFGCRVLPVAYEAVSRDPRAYLADLNRRLHIRLRADYQPVNTYKGEITSHYVPRRYPPLCADDRAHIGRHLDPSIERLWYRSADTSGYGATAPVYLEALVGKDRPAPNRRTE